MLGYISKKMSRGYCPLPVLILLSTICCHGVGALGQSGRDACLQIYSVPRHTVVCEPSEEVRQELDGIKQTLSDHGASLGELGVQVGNLDPDRPKELPEEVMVKLSEVDRLQLTQDNQTHALRDLKSAFDDVSESFAELKSSSRAEFTRMVEMQTELVTAMWHQSNLTLHGEYLDKLNDTVAHFMIQLGTLELGIRDSIQLKETQLLNQMSEYARLSRLEMERLQAEYSAKLMDYLARLQGEKEERLEHWNLTEYHDEVLSEFQLKLENVQLNQKLQEEHQTRTAEELAGLHKLLTSTQNTQTALQNQLASLQISYNILTSDLNQCQSQTAKLAADVRSMKSVVDRWQHITPRTLKVRDCSDALRVYEAVSGVYDISPGPALQPISAYCDYPAAGGAWTVIQRRASGDTDFFRGWGAYRDGFGDVSGEFWLGLQNIHVLTGAAATALRVDLQDWSGKWWYAEYDSFSVDDEAGSYTLHVSGYHGDAGDSLTYHDGMPFTTMDRNSDQKDGLCATWCHGAWWYKDCFLSNLNGRYYPRGPYVPDTNWGDGINWKTAFNTYYYSLKTVEMKIKPAQ